MNIINFSPDPLTDVEESLTASSFSKELAILVFKLNAKLCGGCCG